MRTGGGNFPLRSPWIGAARRRRWNLLLNNAFTVDGNTAQKAVWTDYFFDASGPITLQPSLLTNVQFFFDHTISDVLGDVVATFSTGRVTVSVKYADLSAIVLTGLASSSAVVAAIQFSASTSAMDVEITG